MIDRKLIADTVAEAVEGTGIFTVGISITPDNEITVELDSLNGLDIDTCASITRRLNEVLDRDAEDYSLEVGSAGLTSPFKVAGQYLKNIGRNVEVLTRDGRKLRGVLTDVEVEDNPGAVTLPPEAFTVEIPVKVKEPGAKRPVTVNRPERFTPADVKSVVYMIDFK